jgi:drug/metabolite transporter (DMT)-like permease
VTAGASAAAPAARPIRWRQIGVFVLLSVVWGSTWLIIRDQLGTVAPGWSVTYRFVLATAAMFALAAVRGEALGLDRSGHWMALAIGPAQFAINFQLVYRAEAHLTSGVVAVLFALLFVPNALLGRAFLGQRLTRGFLAGSAIALAGIAMLLLHEARIAPAEGKVALGVALTLVAVLTVSVANVLQGAPAARKQSVFTLTAWAMLWGAVANAALAWLAAGPPTFDPRPGYVAGFAYLAIVGSVVTFPLYFALIRDWGAGRAGYVNVVVPLVAMLLSTLFEGYRWTLLAAGGGALALAGLAIAINARSPSR